MPFNLLGLDWEGKRERKKGGMGGKYLTAAYATPCSHNWKGKRWNRLVNLDTHLKAASTFCCASNARPFSQRM